MTSRLNLAALVKPTGAEDASSSSGDEVKKAAEEASVFRSDPVITDGMIDDAVEEVMRKTQLPPASKVAIRNLLVRDDTAQFATNYYTQQARAPSYVAAKKFERKKLVLHEQLTPEERKDILELAPEYDIEVRPSIGHDHGAGSAGRKICSRLQMDDIPDVVFKDIGGDPIFHILQGNDKAHVCEPLEDPKDPTRRTIRDMRAKRIRDDPSYPVKIRSLAAKYLDRDPSFVCNLRAQDCHYKATFIMSVHVYDIPMEDWPSIMNNSGATVHSGTVHFSPDVFCRPSGVFSVSRAEYHVDIEKDTFTMGFQGSPSWWYSHSFLLYARYGVDQIIEHESGRYSYKIVQKRGDTYFFQIARVGAGAVLRRQCYKLPDVKMVKVEGFEISEQRSWNPATGGFSDLQPRVWWFPAALWSDMLVHAEKDFERGVMSFEKLYNFYRTISPRNTINGVLLSGGERVQRDMVVPLVVHVGLAAASRVLLGKRTNWLLSEQTKHLRSKQAKTKLLSMVNSIGVAAASPMVWAAKVFTGMFSWMLKLGEKELADSLVTWAIEPEIQDVPFSSLVRVGDVTRARWEAYGFAEAEEAYAAPARESHRGMAEEMLEAVPELEAIVDALYGISKPKPASASSVAGGTTVESVTVVDKVEPVYEPSDSERAERLNAIQEAIDEADLEEAKVLEHCRKVMGVCCPHGKPDERLLTIRSEEYGNPDIWFINGGVLVDSVLGQPVAGFRHAAVYTLSADPSTQSHLRAVRDQASSAGNEYKVIEDQTYTGHALVVDRLLIHNGPEIRAALRMALELPHDYKVVVSQGPPGCGKTYDMIAALQVDDVCMCPVRESALDTRARVKDKYKHYPDPKNRISTVDSYLVNLFRNAKKNLVAARVHADECFMTAAGRWYAVAALLRVKEVVAYGDLHQIPHVPRVQASTIYLRIRPSEVVYKWVTYRCPADAVACWGHIYDWKVRSLSKVKNSMHVVKDHASLSMPLGLVVLVMYQADKKAAAALLKPHLKDKKIRIMTVHESEGKTFEHVWLMRFDSRPRSDGMSLFDKPPYCLVAMSRHTNSFHYVRPRDVGDLVDKWLVMGREPRRVVAAAQAASAGERVEFA